MPTIREVLGFRPLRPHLPLIAVILLSGCGLVKMGVNGYDATEASPYYYGGNYYEYGTGGPSFYFGGGGAATGGVPLTERGYRMERDRSGNPIVAPFCESSSTCFGDRGGRHHRQNPHTRRSIPKNKR